MNLILSNATVCTPWEVLEKAGVEISDGYVRRVVSGGALEISPPAPRRWPFDLTTCLTHPVSIALLDLNGVDGEENLCIGGRQPPGTKGNSEAGHLNIGAGRVVLQDEVRIKQAIERGEFIKNPLFHEALAFARKNKGAFHLLGLLSKQSSHGSIDYVYELLKLAKVENFALVYVHLITDGRSTEPGSAPQLLREVGQVTGESGVGTVVTVLGRGLALDRGGDYLGKTQRAYRALVFGEGTLCWSNTLVNLITISRRGKVGPLTSEKLKSC